MRARPILALSVMGFAATLAASPAPQERPDVRILPGEIIEADVHGVRGVSEVSEYNVTFQVDAEGSVYLEQLKARIPVAGMRRSQFEELLENTYRMLGTFESVEVGARIVGRNPEIAAAAKEQEKEDVGSSIIVAIPEGRVEQYPRPVDPVPLQPADRVRVLITGIPMPQRIEDVVDGAGEMDLPYLGTIYAGGMTAADLEALIREQYIEQGIFKSLAVRVERLPREGAFRKGRYVYLSEDARRGLGWFSLHANAAHEILIESNANLVGDFWLPGEFEREMEKRLGLLPGLLREPVPPIDPDVEEPNPDSFQRLEKPR